MSRKGFTEMLDQRVIDIYDRKYGVDGVSEKQEVYLMRTA
jgi:hypothetical protein